MAIPRYENGKDPLAFEFETPPRFSPKNAEVQRKNLQDKNIDPNQGAYHKAIRAIEQAGRVFKDVEKARKLLNNDDSRSKMNKRIAITQYSAKKREELSAIVNEGEQAINKYIRSIDNEIEEKMEQKALKSSFAKATWEHVRGLEDRQTRRSFINQAINNQQWDVVDDILGLSNDRSFLAGLKPKDLAMMKEQYKQQRFSEEIRLRDAAKEIEKEFDYATLPAIQQFDRFDSEEVNQAITQSKKTENFLNE